MALETDQYGQVGLTSNCLDRELHAWQSVTVRHRELTAKQDNGKGHIDNKAEPCGALPFMLPGLSLLPIIVYLAGIEEMSQKWTYYNSIDADDLDEADKAFLKEMHDTYGDGPINLRREQAKE